MRSIFTVTGPADETSLLSLAELRVAVGDGVDDASLMALGRGVSLAISRACGVASDGINPPTLLSETCSQTFRLKRCVPRLRLARRPVTAIASATVDGETLDPAEYEVDPASALMERICGDWPACTVVVAFTAGYQAAQGDLKIAATKLATAIQSDAGRDPNLKREDIPGLIEREYWVSEKDNPLMSQEIHDLIAPYVERWL